MSLSRRIFLYLMGVGMGCILVYFYLLRGRTSILSAWLPENRVIEEMSALPLSSDAKTTCLLNCLNLTTAQWPKALATAEVVFNESQPRATTRTYVLTDIAEANKLTVQLEDSLSLVAAAGEDCNCQ